MSNQNIIGIGRHDVKVVGVEITQSMMGSYGIELSFQTQEGASITDTLWLTKKAIPMTMEKLKGAFGFNGELREVKSQVMGKKCTIAVGEEKTDKGMRPRVFRIAPLAKPLDDKTMDELSAELKSAINGDFVKEENSDNVPW